MNDCDQDKIIGTARWKIEESRSKVTEQNMKEILEVDPIIGEEQFAIDVRREDTKKIKMRSTNLQLWD